MPIYAYKCESCGHSKDVLQKISDTPLTVCPNCGEAAFKKQVTAAGFQLKGSGWYVTDFRGGSSAATPPPSGGGAEGGAPAGGSKPADSPAPAPAPAPAADKPASTPSSSSGSSGSSGSSTKGSS